MSVDQVNYINIGLMAASAALAFTLPFELFLFSYAVLGPAHYLTEISWLHDRRYFTNGNQDYLVLVLLSVLILLGSGIFQQVQLKALQPYSTALICYGFGIALIFVVTEKIMQRVFGAIALLIVTAVSAVGEQEWGVILFSIYLPTMIHVYVFTGAFILYGALKSRRISGYVSMVAFIVIAWGCLSIDLGVIPYAASQLAKDSYDTFGVLNYYLVQHLGLEKFTTMGEVFTSESSLLVTRFIAFAYTYHYLNWFSKTSIIKWHQVPFARCVVVVIAWIASVGLYAYDYKLGFQWLFLLSFMHVFLEFPLNHRSFIGIGQEVRKRIKSAAIGQPV